MNYRFGKAIVAVLLLIVMVQFFSSCKKDTFLTNGGTLSFSTDTLKFDTVFTTLGSVTRSFKIYNTNNKRVKINQIRLEKGTQSYFRMNIDGVPTKDISDIEIAANDSIYVFVALTINPTNGNNPFIIEDKVVINLNNTISAIPLEAYGQDAHFISDSVLKSQTWINDKPYVIIHSCLVDSAQVLTIQKGCRIYMHADSKMYVAGTLKVFGTKTDSVVFQGDRLDRDYFGYKDTPSEWGGFYFTQSSNQCNLNYCVIKNAGNSTGDGAFPAAVLVAPTPNLGGPIVEFNSCTIANSGGYGVLAFNTNLHFNNCLIHSCGLQNVLITEGGDYEFNYCTIANYGGYGLNHAQEPTAVFINYRELSDGNFVGNNLKLKCANTIIYGSLEDEVLFDKKSTWAYDVKMENSLLKRKTPITAGLINELNALAYNSDPQFINYGKWNFHPKTTSPVKGAGVYLPLYPFDLDGNNRSTTAPSVGCYEVQ